MCGIFCEYNVRVDNKRIEKIQSLLKHRGPDASGVLQLERLTMIHTRLSIIDLSQAGNQPMANHSEDVWLIFNGEIYNYLELKKEISDFPFKSQSDSEVILACYEKWGEKFIERLRGMFAFCLYDKKKDKLILAVDRFSIKPLYYYYNNNRLIASSEIKPILLFLNERSVNFTALGRFLNYGMLDYDNDTLFKNIFQLQGGEMIIWSNGCLKKRRYWDISKIPEKKYSIENFIDLTEEKLKEAIELHWRSDVEVGLNLSSGLDSNTLYEFSKDCFSKQKSLRGFTFCFPGTVYDEGSRIDSNRFNLEHVKTNISTNNFFKRLEEFIYVLEEPSLGLNCLGYYENSKSMHNKGIKVVLDGQGADEIFAGYKYYYIEHLKHLYFEKRNNFHAELKTFLSVHNESRSQESFIKEEILSKEIKAVQAPDGTALDSNNFVHKKFQKRYFSPFPQFPKPFKNPVKNTMYRDLIFLKIPKLLKYQDKAAMASSVEVRVPYLDHELVETVFGANVEMNLREGKTKAALREIYNKFRVQDSSSEDCKLYVSAPQREWIKRDLKDQIIEYIDSSVLADEGIIDRKKLKGDYLAYCNSRELGNSFFIWKFVNLEIWFRKFIKNRE